MRECNQTKDWSTTIFGETLPKYEFYGKVGRVVYRLDYFTGRLLLHDEKRNRWKPATFSGKGAIADAVTAYIKIHGVSGTKIEVCKYSGEAKKRAFHDRKRAEAETRRDLMSGAPVMRTGRISASGAARHDFDGSRRRCAVESDRVWGNPVETFKKGKIEIVYVDPKAPNAISADERDKGYAQFFEMGQNTSGTAGKYARSGFETKDGLKVAQNKIRPERMQKPDYMRRQGQPSGTSMDKLSKMRYESAKTSVISEYGESVLNNKAVRKVLMPKQDREIRYYEGNYRK